MLAGTAFAIGAGLAMLGGAAVTAQTAAAPLKTELDAAQTTLSGIYTEVQVTRGEETYYASCVSCHPKGTYAGLSFKTMWGDRPLSDLYDWILNKMPKNDPGTLTPEQSVEVIAYILKENGMPAGKTKMPADEAALKAIRIQLR